MDDLGGALAPGGARLRNPLLADTYERLGAVRRRPRARRGSTPRATPGTAAGWPRRSSTRSRVPALDSSGEAHAGVLGGDDLAAFSAVVRGAGLAATSAAGRCSRPGRGARGRCSCSSSRCSTGWSSARSWASSTCTRVLEGAKLAFADREAWYGDSAPVPLDALLSRAYADARRALIGAEASARAAARRPGGRLPSVRAGAVAGAAWASRRAATPAISTSPTAWQPRRGHAQRRLAAELARDRRSRVLPGHARADVLARGRAAGVAGRPACGRARRCRRRWRCTTTARCSRSARPAATSRTSGRCEFFLAHAVFGLDLQAAIDAPMFHTDALPELLLPARGGAAAGRVEAALPAATMRALRERGHAVRVADGLVAGPAERDLPRARRAAARRRQPARDAGLRRRSLAAARQLRE